MDERTQDVAEELTTPPEMTDTPAAEEAADTTAAAAAAEPTEDTAPVEEAAVPPADDPVTVPVRFRHESRQLSMEEAATYAQMGLQYEAQQPMMDKLRMMAAGQGQSLSAFVDAWAKAEEEAMRQKLLEQAGGDEETAERLWRLEREDRQKACQAREQQAQQQAERALPQRLAAEFGELRQAFPAIGGFEALPQSVLQDAAAGRHLLDAYLRYEHGQRRRVEEHRASQAAAAAASAGSQADHPTADTLDANTAAMLRGVRSVFE